MSYLRYYKHLRISQKANGGWNMISCCKLRQKKKKKRICWCNFWLWAFVMCWIWIDKEKYPGHSLPQTVCYHCIRKRATKSAPTGALLHRAARTALLTLWYVCLWILSALLISSWWASLLICRIGQFKWFHLWQPWCDRITDFAEQIGPGGCRGPRSQSRASGLCSVRGLVSVWRHF